MAVRYFEMSPPVAAAVKAGIPLVLLETGYFAAMPAEEAMHALASAEQVIWQKGCVPCAVAVVGGRLKAGLSQPEAEFVFKTRTAAVRGDLALLCSRKATSAVGPSAALAIGRQVGVIPAVLPSLSDEVHDLDALGCSAAMVFCHPLDESTLALMDARSIPVTEADPAADTDAWVIQQELFNSESIVCQCGDTVESLCAAASDAAMLLKKKTDYI